MSSQKDDLQAVKIIAEALKDFDKSDQERIIRWAREKVGLDQLSAPAVSPPQHPSTTERVGLAPAIMTTIKDFIENKSPIKDVHFAATVAYYYQFEAGEGNKKESINGNDLQEACRLSGRKRFKRTDAVLNNAEKMGLLDRLDRGQFKINPVGENLVAMGLPTTGTSKIRKATSSKPSKRKKSSRKNG